MLRQGPCPQGAHSSVQVYEYKWLLEEETGHNKRCLPGEGAIEVA